MKYTVQVKDIGKQFAVFPKDQPQTLQEAFIKGTTIFKKREKYWALRHISFQVPHGHVLGVIGKNGAGKSTLLRLLSRVSRPDEGQIRTNGRLGGLLELGTGFHPNLTGRDNVFTNGIICGLTKKEVQERFDQIVSFAELEEVIDDPLRTYSTGMRMRLGFAVAAHTDPDILLVDEVLAVGDEAFQKKCFQKINTFRRDGKTIIIVSHNLSQIVELCDKVIWLHKGEIRFQGTAQDTVNEYLAASM